MALGSRWLHSNNILLNLFSHGHINSVGPRDLLSSHYVCLFFVLSVVIRNSWDAFVLWGQSTNIPRKSLRRGFREKSVLSGFLDAHGISFVAWQMMIPIIVKETDEQVGKPLDFHAQKNVAFAKHPWPPACLSEFLNLPSLLLERMISLTIFHFDFCCKWPHPCHGQMSSSIFRNFPQQVNSFASYPTVL